MGPKLVATYVLGALQCVACLDVSPLAPNPDVVADAGLSDAPAGETGCRSCITDDAGACAAYQECTQNPQCVVFMDCVFERRCLDLPEWDQRVDCALPCTEVAGIPTVTDPAIGIAINVNLCAVEVCGHVCVGAGSS
jgi:hypothetical protein